MTVTRLRETIEDGTILFNLANVKKDNDKPKVCSLQNKRLEGLRYDWIFG